MPNWPVVPGHSDGIAINAGHAVAWHEPGWPTFREAAPHAYATLEVVAAPNLGDLGLSDALAARQLMHVASTAVLANAALMAGCASLELRYVVEPQAAGGSAIRMYVTALCRDWNPAPAQTAVMAACSALPAGFIWTLPKEPMRLADAAITDEDLVVLELRREEEVTLPQWDYVPAEFYYSIKPASGDGSGWHSFWTSLSHVREPTQVSLLFQQTAVHEIERNVLAGVLTDLALLSEQRTDYDLYGNPVVVPACANARAARECWENQLQVLRRPLLARLAVRAEPITAVTVATALAGAVGQGSDGSHPLHYEAARTATDVKQSNFSFDWLEILPWGGHAVWTHPTAPNSLRRFTHLFGLEQASSLAILPVPDEQGVTGMPRSRTLTTRRQPLSNDLVGSGLRLGRGVHLGEPGSDVALPLEAPQKHLLVVGSSGFGKTTTVQSLLLQLWRDHQVPFLVLEPYPRSEYRSLSQVPGLHEFQVQEYMAAGSLEHLFAQQTITREFATELTREMSTALAFIHTAGVTHGDLKPGNILIRTLEPLDVVVADFGLAMQQDLSVVVKSVAGSWPYLPPESRANEFTPAMDWWALGLILAKGLTRRHMFQEPDGPRMLNDATIANQLARNTYTIPATGDQRWDLLIAGLLTAEYRHRWNTLQVDEWMAGGTPEVHTTPTPSERTTAGATTGTTPSGVTTSRHHCGPSRHVRLASSPAVRGNDTVHGVGWTFKRDHLLHAGHWIRRRHRSVDRRCHRADARSRDLAGMVRWHRRTARRRFHRSTWMTAETAPTGRMDILWGPILTVGAATLGSLLARVRGS